MRKKIDVSRRDFLKGSLVVGGTGLALGMAGCAPKVAETPVPGAPTVVSADWLGTEPVIDTVAETVETDVVVIGGGTGGAYAAASCLEKGLKVVILEKNAITSTVRNDWGAIGSKWQVEGGESLDPATIFTPCLILRQPYRSRLPRIWADESGSSGQPGSGDLIVSKEESFDWEGGYEPDLNVPHPTQSSPPVTVPIWKSKELQRPDDEGVHRGDGWQVLLRDHPSSSSSTTARRSPAAIAKR